MPCCRRKITRPWHQNQGGTLGADRSPAMASAVLLAGLVSGRPGEPGYDFGHFGITLAGGMLAPAQAALQLHRMGMAGRTLLHFFPVFFPFTGFISFAPRAHCFRELCRQGKTRRRHLHHVYGKVRRSAQMFFTGRKFTLEQSVNAAEHAVARQP